MATTTNYGWVTPDDTALVKDGAAAIRTLGSSADTTTKNLNPETTLGDLSFRSSTSNVNTRIGIGTAGQNLTVVAGVPAWATSSSGGMTLISTTSLSGASVTLSSIPATFNNLQLVIRDILPATDGAGLRIRLNSDSAANRYAVSAWGAGAGTAIFIDQDALNDTVSSLDNAVTENLTIINLYDYTNTVTFKYGTTQGVSCASIDPTQVTRGAYHLFYNQTPAISSITLFMSSGNITSGTALLYGVK